MIQKLMMPAIGCAAGIMCRIDSRIRTVLLSLCVLVFIFSTYVYQADEFLGFVTPASVNAIIGFFCFAGITLLGISPEMKRVDIREIPLYLLMICGILVFISGFHHYIGYSYMIMGLFMLLLMPVFVLVWSHDIDRLLKIVAWVNIILFVLYFIVNCVIAPAGDPLYTVSGRYFGIASDPNGMAKTAVSAVVCAVYMLFHMSGKIRCVMIPILSMAIALVYLTISRANMIALLIVIVFALIIALKNIIINGKEHRKPLLSLLAVCLVTLLLVPAALKCCEAGYAPDVDAAEGVSVAEEQSAAPQGDPGQAVSVPEQGESHSDSVVRRATQGTYEDGSIDLDAASSGRLTIWKYCFDNLSMIGVSPDEGIKIDLGKEHAHNTVLEVAYRSGIPAGICFLLIELICAAWIIKSLISRKMTSPAETFAVLAITAFGIASLFDIVVLPFAKITVFFFYIAWPVMVRRGEKKNDSLKL